MIETLDTALGAMTSTPLWSVGAGVLALIFLARRSSRSGRRMSD